MVQSTSLNHSSLLRDLRVLIIDDDDDSSTLLMFILEQSGAETKIATTTAAALELVIQFCPNVLLSDINLPDEDGYMLIRRVRALSASQGGQTPAIAITGYALPEVHERALSEGFQQCLTKPIDLDELIAAVESLVKQNRECEKL